ncbi:hypothetical protein ACTNBL_12815 [Enterococcus villorum]|jgi:hypothetical protein|uniref:Lipoprotein n=2 Tax=Enterococcus villorum TaxID=112904 RepID=A0A511J366_9ENTE|nr:hypothetical protein [Enterococcus villorum]EOH86156.1 hypothetical protein UAO_02541 [Enterococcus villorum ATCC 700913]EOW78770.1 hypothetical protein I591_00313 [Enterococcus villorum ATCC 700913]GEL92457.1 hypothetical protein EVI01_17940 [Enterococcus villorum]
MKKLGLLIPAILLLSACQGANHSTKTTETSTQTTTSSTVQSTNRNVSETSTTQSTTKTSAESSSQKDTTTKASDETSTTNQKQQTAFDQLKENYPSTPMPQEIPIGSGNLNVAAAETKQGFSIIYYDLPKAYVLNAKELNQETPIASYLYQYGFASSQEAINALQPITIDTNGRQVDLGYNITAYQQGAAGSSILEWQEGNWRIRIRASNVEGQDPVPLAKEIVAYLEKASLPAPEKYGKITIEMNDASNQSAQVSWQEPKNVYTVTHKDALSALKMAVSMNQ